MMKSRKNKSFVCWKIEITFKPKKMGHYETLVSKVDLVYLRLFCILGEQVRSK